MRSRIRSVFALPRSLIARLLPAMQTARSHFLFSSTVIERLEREGARGHLPRSLHSRARSRIPLAPVSQLLRETKGAACSLPTMLLVQLPWRRDAQSRLARFRKHDPTLTELVGTRTLLKSRKRLWDFKKSALHFMNVKKSALHFMNVKCWVRPTQLTGNRSQAASRRVASWHRAVFSGSAYIISRTAFHSKAALHHNSRGFVIYGVVRVLTRCWLPLPLPSPPLPLPSPSPSPPPLSTPFPSPSFLLTSHPVYWYSLKRSRVCWHRSFASDRHDCLTADAVSAKHCISTQALPLLSHEGGSDVIPSSSC